jgi:hypothetical protein
MVVFVYCSCGDDGCCWCCYGGGGGGGGDDDEVGGWRKNGADHGKHQNSALTLALCICSGVTRVSGTA